MPRWPWVDIHAGLASVAFRILAGGWVELRNLSQPGTTLLGVGVGESVCVLGFIWACMLVYVSCNLAVVS